MSEVHGAGAEKNPIAFRTQPGFSWKGVRPDVEPQDLPPDVPRILLNMRLEGGRIEGRPGRSYHVDLVDPITGLVDHRIATQRSLVMTHNGCPGVGPSGLSIGSFDTEQSPNYQRLIYYSAETSLTGIIATATFGDDLYFGLGDKLVRLQTSRPPYGSEELANGQEVPLWTVPSPYLEIAALLEHNGSLVISAIKATGDTEAAVFSYDGLTVTMEKDLSPDGFMSAFGLYRDKLIGGLYAGGVQVRASDGTWGATVAPSAGDGKFLKPHSGTSYKDLFYFPNQGTDIYSFDETTLTRIPAATTGVTATISSIVWLESAFGYLWYLWYDTNGKTRLGRFDGTTWNADYKTLESGFATGFNIDTPQSMRFYAGDLFIAGLRDGVGSYGTVYRSDKDDISGTWTVVSGQLTASGFHSLVVY